MASSRAMDMSFVRRGGPPNRADRGCLLFCSGRERAVSVVGPERSGGFAAHPLPPRRSYRAFWSKRCGARDKLNFTPTAKRLELYGVQYTTRARVLKFTKESLTMTSLP
jgi:hypothetical protein